jgi:hypothetical protein
MNKNIIEYYLQVHEDDALQAAYSGCESTEQMSEIAVEQGRKLGFFFTKEDALATGFDFETLQNAANSAISNWSCSRRACRSIAAPAPPDCSRAGHVFIKSVFV